MPLTLAVILCTRNRPDDLARCLDSLAVQTRPADEVWVIDASDAPVDAGPTGQRPVNVGATGPPVSDSPPAPSSLHIIHTTPGLPSQRNLGLRRTQTDVVAFFDDDVELEPDYLAALMAAYERHWAAGVGGICGSTPGWRQSSEGAAWLKQVFGLTHVLASGDSTRVLRSLGVIWIAQCLCEIPGAALPGHCMSFRRTALADAGIWFDESLGGYADGEDVDVSLRLGRLHPLFQIPGARLVHHRSRAERAHLRRRFMTRTRNERYLHRKLMAPTLRNRLAFAWSTLGRLIIAASVALKHRTPAPVQGVIEGLREGKKLTGSPVDR